jgi:DNA polymerase-3 subunit epsilon
VSPPKAGPAPADLQRCAALLDASDDFRVLRRLRLTPRAPPPNGAETRRAVIVDVETTGLDHAADEIVELAMLAIDYSLDGSFVTAVESFDQLRDPGRPMPPEVKALTGIDDAVVAGKRIDAEAVETFVGSAALVIAHNAAFDRPFCERLFPVFSDKPWGCSFRDVDWRAEGFEAARLSHLANCYGFFFDGHRALNDCEATAELLARRLPRSGGTAMSRLLESARRPRWRIRAERAPFAARAVLKSRGYRWDAGGIGAPVAWWTEVSEAAFEEERRFLSSEVYRGGEAPIASRLSTALDRYSDRLSVLAS